MFLWFVLISRYFSDISKLFINVFYSLRFRAEKRPKTMDRLWFLIQYLKLSYEMFWHIWMCNIWVFSLILIFVKIELYHFWFLFIVSVIGINSRENVLFFFIENSLLLLLCILYNHENALFNFHMVEFICAICFNIFYLKILPTNTRSIFFSK